MTIASAGVRPAKDHIGQLEMRAHQNIDVTIRSQADDLMNVVNFFRLRRMDRKQVGLLHGCRPFRQLVPHARG